MGIRERIEELVTYTYAPGRGVNHAVDTILKLIESEAVDRQKDLIERLRMVKTNRLSELRYNDAVDDFHAKLDAERDRLQAAVEEEGE